MFSLTIVAAAWPVSFATEILQPAFSAPWRSPAPVPLMRSFIAFATYSVFMPAWMMAMKDCGES
jgi:hypothetical protein